MFGREAPGDEAQAIRDQLLQPLLTATAEESLDILSDGEVLDTAVSVALASVDESEYDHLSVLTLTAAILASMGEFPRIAQLAPLFRDLARAFSAQRPFLTVVLEALSNWLARSPQQALVVLVQSLGLGESSPPTTTKPRTRQNVIDVYLATVFARWLRERDTSVLAEARKVILDSGLADDYSVIDLIFRMAQSTQRAAVPNVLSGHAGYESARLRSYVESREQHLFFPAQLKAIESGALDRPSSLLAMPTSSGKTLLAELRIIKELSGSPGTRAIYVTPYRLLARQVESALRDGLRRAGLTIRDLGAEFDTSSPYGDEQSPPDVIVVTPERLDGLLRARTSTSGSDELTRNVLTSASLLVFDEVHLLARTGRGPRLEMLLLRWHQQFPHVKVLALSGGGENLDDLSEWLSGSRSISVGERPTGTIELLWRTDGTVVQRFEGKPSNVMNISRSKVALDDAAELILSLKSHLLPALAIETTRPLAENLARRIQEKSPAAGTRWRLDLAPNQLHGLETAAEQARATLGDAHNLHSLLRDGIAYHHAGVPANLLRLIEELAAMRALRVVTATTTVAEGAHLPFQIVVIPHLNFQTGQGKLDRSLYQNIVGRAGRANVSIEGVVVVIDSDSPTLKNYVTRVLWDTAEPRRAKGCLNTISETAGSVEQLRGLRDFDSQILAWLGEPGSHVDDQSRYLAEQTFTWRTANRAGREQLQQLISARLSRLEEQRLVKSASPYVLTFAGERARLAGMGPDTCLRLSDAINRRTGEGFWRSLRGSLLLSQDLIPAIAGLLLEAEEVVEQGLWFRREAKTDQQRLALLRGLRMGSISWPYNAGLFQADSDLLIGWISGVGFAELGAVPPTTSKLGYFSNDDPGVRAADAADIIGHLAYPASWTWAAAVAMLGAEQGEVPLWIRRAIELGVPSEVSVELIRSVGLSRTGAMSLAQILPIAWGRARDELLGMSAGDLRVEAITEVDQELVFEWQASARP